MRNNPEFRTAMLKNQFGEECAELAKKHPDAVNRIFTDGVNIGYGYGRGEMIGFVAGSATVLALTGLTVIIVQKLKNKKS